MRFYRIQVDFFGALGLSQEFLNVWSIASGLRFGVGQSWRQGFRSPAA